MIRISIQENSYLDISSKNDPSYGGSKNWILLQDSDTNQKWSFFAKKKEKWTKKVIWWRKIKIRPVAPFVGIKTEQQICKTMLGKCICNILRGVNIFWSYICRIHVRHHLVGICVALSVKIYWWYFDLLHIAVFRIVGSMQCFTQKNVSIHHDLFYE